MQPQEILEKCGHLEIKREKKVTPDYVELVFFVRDTAAWMKLLSGIFGKAVKPTWQKPTGRDHQLTKEFGGIRTEQTLFMKDFNGYTVLAMVWPWKDKTLCSLKIPLIRTEEKDIRDKPSCT
jgi:hypothetical protein